MRLIDADALLKQLEVHHKKCEEDAKFSGNRGITATWDDAINAIENAPTIDPVKHGRWEVDAAHGADVLSGENMVLCSVCGKGHFFGEWGFEFCPWCGARMDEAEE